MYDYKDLEKIKKEIELLVNKAELYTIKNPGKSLAIVGGVCLGLGLIGGFLLGFNIKRK